MVIEDNSMHIAGNKAAYPMEDVAGYLRKHGIYPTCQRVKVAETILTKPGHYCADEVYEMVNAEAPEVSKATIYNTLNIFVQKDVLHQLLVDPTKIYYDSNLSPHNHLYNVDTGSITDFESEEGLVSGLPDIPEGARFDGMDVIIRVKNQP